MSRRTVTPADSVDSVASDSLTTQPTRREFLEKAAVVGAGVAAVSLLGTDAVRAAGGSSAPIVRPSRALPIDSIDPDKAVSYFDEVGRLRHNIAPATYETWKSQLHNGTLTDQNPRVAAVLHLWLGEYELNANEDPTKAEWHFRTAQALVPSPHDRLHGWAAYNLCVNTVYQGDYNQAVAAFHDLLHHTPLLGGFSRKNAALFARHINACAAEHNALGDLGIPRPPRLDPYCGAAALAACLRGLGLASDRRSVLRVCKVTGRGNTMSDLHDACQKMSDVVTGRVIQADEHAIQHLPMPMVAFIERDHFVAIVRADKEGVSYLCSDCGA